MTTFNPGANLRQDVQVVVDERLLPGAHPEPGINSVPFSLKKVGDRSVLPFGCLSTPTCKPNGQPN